MISIEFVLSVAATPDADPSLFRPLLDWFNLDDPWQPALGHNASRRPDDDPTKEKTPGLGCVTTYLLIVVHPRQHLTEL